MKKILTTTFVFVLLLAVSPTAGTKAAQDGSAAPSPPEQLTLTFELQDLPGRNATGSFWQVSYQWRIADKRDFDRWANEGENPIQQNSLGSLLSKRSFIRRNLSELEGRRFITTVPVKGELFERLRHGDQQPQIVWLDAFVRIHDAELDTTIVEKVNPAWGPHFYRVGTANVRMELTGDGKFQWYRGDTPPWVASQTPSPK
jgi:hypothetical protein